MLQSDDVRDGEDADIRAAKRYFSGDDDEGWQRGAPKGSSEDDAPTEGVSSSTIVSGLVASRKEDHAVGSSPNTQNTSKCHCQIYISALGSWVLGCEGRCWQLLQAPPPFNVRTAVFICCMQEAGSQLPEKQSPCFMYGSSVWPKAASLSSTDAARPMRNNERIWCITQKHRGRMSRRRKRYGNAYCCVYAGMIV